MATLVSGVEGAGTLLYCITYGLKMLRNEEMGFVGLYALPKIS